MPRKINIVQECMSPEIRQAAMEAAQRDDKQTFARHWLNAVRYGASKHPDPEVKAYCREMLTPEVLAELDAEE